MRIDSSPSLADAASGGASLRYPLLLRTPAIVVLWALIAGLGAAGIALGRVRIPDAATGTVIVVSPAEGQALLLLPPTARRHAARRATVRLELERWRSVAATIDTIEPRLLTDAEARRRFPDDPALYAQLDGPRVVARLTPCRGCGLGATRGLTYRARVAFGSRSLARYFLFGGERGSL